MPNPPDLRTAASQIQATAHIIQDEMQRVPELRKRFSVNHRKLFSIDLALVAHNIRTGCLLDLVAPENAVQDFSILLGSLRANGHTKDLFTHVLHIFEPSSEQSFFVNTRLLAGRIQTISLVTNSSTGSSNCGNPSPVFLQLVFPIKILDAVPSDLLHLLDSLYPVTFTSDSLPLSFPLPIDVGVEVAVPLAAVLLDYPIAYIPSLSKPHTLSGSALDFYECILLSGTDDRNNIFSSGHTIMKLSCPAGIDSPNCQPEILMSRLKAMFEERFRLIDDTSLRCSIIYTSQIVNHVAF